MIRNTGFTTTRLHKRGIQPPINHCRKVRKLNTQVL